MTIILNDNTIELPSSLSGITLGQRIAFHEQYGEELDEMIITVQKTEDPIEKELASVNFNYEKMLRVFAFMADITLEAASETEFIDVIATVYHSRLSALFSDNPPEQLQTIFAFKDEEWILSEPELKNGSLMSFGEFIDAKQLVKDLIDAGKGKWQIVQYLAAIYLRKKDEAYKEEFLYESSERLKLMQELPMDIAQHIDFFLSGIMNSSTVILKYLERAVLKEQERTFGNILTNMDGSIFSNRLRPQRFSTSQGAARTASIAPGRLN